eukprot:TRINITY_DN2305_c0_g2_i3.p1 TRINITY_DN2305_c0_g2~~TRINITY_DN2305_c0_g2_i3.p1  ORF type:complete len:373 (+),score=104.47 TRINITY_DN2305_c0_g2_i3:72-1190(+)
MARDYGTRAWRSASSEELRHPQAPQKNPVHGASHLEEATSAAPRTRYVRTSARTSSTTSSEASNNNEPNNWNNQKPNWTYNGFSTEQFVKMCEQEHWIKQQFPLDRPHNDSQRRRIKRQRQRFREHLGLEEPPENRVRWLDEALAHRMEQGVSWFLPAFHHDHHDDAAGMRPGRSMEMIAEMLQWCDELRRRWEGYIAKTLRDYGVPVDLLRHAVASQQWETVASLAQAGRAHPVDVLHFLWVDAPNAASQRTLAKLRAEVSYGKFKRRGKTTPPPVVKALRVYEEMVRVYQGDLGGSTSVVYPAHEDDGSLLSDAHSRGRTDSIPQSPCSANLAEAADCGSDDACSNATEEWQDVNDDDLLRFLSIDNSCF